ncbi:MAG: TIGR04283 family arsenosugar biosynthesis glycosyltransferase [Planctomycetota bacterium]
MSGRVSVIIPTWNERSYLPAAVASVGADPDTEILVADGDSQDGTKELADRIADRMIPSKRGRSSQMNAGAAHASGEILLFLHADTRLPPGAITAIRQAMERPDCVGGAFRFAIDSQRRSLRFIAMAANFRSRILGLPFGDQALFVKSTIFEAMAGFRELPIMEDLEFVKRLRRRGRLCIIDQPALTSDRRWRRNGVTRTTLVNMAALGMYKLAFEPERIRAFYDAKLSTPPRSGHQ